MYKEKAEKPLGKRAYGSIPHLPGSRKGPAEKGISGHQAQLVTDAPRDGNDVVICQEKLDGSCCAVLKKDNELYPMNRVGYPALSSSFELHHNFHDYVTNHAISFISLLDDNEYCVGEWLQQAHGTLYHLPHDYFVIFDIIKDGSRKSYVEVSNRCRDEGFPVPYTIINIGEAISIEKALDRFGEFGHHGAQEQIEGAVWRMERNNKVDFLCKYVRPDKEDGKYLPEISGIAPVFNTRIGHS